MAAALSFPDVRRGLMNMAMPFPRSRFAAVLLALLLAMPLGHGAAIVAHAMPDDAPAVEVQRHAGAVLVDVSMFVPATPQQAWAVLTDYDHMSAFFPNLQSSRVIERENGKLKVEQKGAVRYGPLSFPFEMVREIELHPYAEIRSRALSGSVKRGTAVTKLIPEARGTRIVYHSEAVPNVWVPPGIGPKFIENETRAQFEFLRAEILRRSKASPHS